jgi:O-antigen/teichoic acid export membrane protein
MGIGFVSMVILTRTLGAPGFGVYVLVTTIHTIAGSAYQLAPPQLVIADLSRFIGVSDFARVRRLLGDYLSVQMALGVVAAAALFTIRPLVLDRWGDPIASAIALVSVWLMVSALRSFTEVVLASHGAFGAISLWHASESAVRLAAICIFVVVFDFSIAGAVMADIAAQSIGLALVFPRLLLTIKYLRPYQRTTERVLLSGLRAHGKWAALNGISVRLIGAWPSWFIALVLSTEALAIYTVAKRCLAPAKAALPLKRVLAPLLARNVTDPERLSYLFHKGLQYRLLINIAATVAGSVLAYPVLSVLFPDLYPQVVLIFQLLLLRLIAATPMEALNNLFAAEQQQRYSFYVYVLSQILAAIVGVPLVLAVGLAGAPSSQIVTTLVSSAYQLWLATRMPQPMYLRPSTLLAFDRRDAEFLWSALIPKRRIATSK